MMNRRHFVQLSAGTCFAVAFSSFQLPASETESSALELKEIRKLKFTFGLEKPFRALHVSDSHITFADERENERKRTLAENRGKYFSKAEAYLNASVSYAQKNKELFLHTGDLIDFVSEKNLEVASRTFKDLWTVASSGNHEFSQYVGEAKEDAAYKAQSYDRVQRAFPNDLMFCSKVINGVNFVAIDDVYYNFTSEQLTRFKEEVQKGLPIVMLCHVPLYTPELFDLMVEKKESCAYVTGAPEERIKGYTAHRFEQQKPDEPTLEFLAWLKEQPLVKVILCGHLHFFWSGAFSKHTMQYVVGGNYLGEAYEIDFE